MNNPPVLSAESQGCQIYSTFSAYFFMLSVFPSLDTKDSGFWHHKYDGNESEN